jgi:predicted AAA+ superfamily ATPase
MLHDLLLITPTLLQDRKPLVIRGARQVGKTTVIHQFAQQFEQYIYLNVEIKENLCRSR